MAKKKQGAANMENMFAQQMMNFMNPAALPMGFPGAQQQQLFYAAIDGRQAGPFQLTEISRLVGAGSIRKDTLVWRQGLASWQSAAATPEIAGLFPAAPPLPPVSAPLPPVTPPQTAQKKVPAKTQKMKNITLLIFYWQSSSLTPGNLGRRNSALCRKTCFSPKTTGWQSFYNPSKKNMKGSGRKQTKRSYILGKTAPSAARNWGKGTLACVNCLRYLPGV